MLLIFEIAAKDIGPRLGTETWEVFLRVMLGITDYLLKETTEETNNLATKLAPMLMRVCQSGSVTNRVDLVPSLDPFQVRQPYLVEVVSSILCWMAS